MSDTYEDQLSAARYKAERDQARQRLAGLMKSVDDLDDENERLRDMLNGIAWKLGIGREVHYLSDDNYAECHKRVLDEIRILSAPTSYDVAQVTSSAYDLLPEEDREALQWLREQGGLDSVKKLLDWVVGHCSTKQQLDFDFWLSGRVMHELGFDEDMADRDEVERRLLARLMPEGMEWPRFEDNEPVAFGDYAEIGDCIGPIVSVTIRSADNTSLEKPAYDIAVLRSGFVNHSPIEPFSVRVKRPAVIAADGEPLHERETVWEVDTGDGYVVERIYSGTTEPDFPGHTVACRRPDDIVTHMFKPSQLTHERPDSWERLEEDAKSLCHDIAMYLGDYSPSDFEKSGDSVQDRVIETVRRCRALAERGE